MKLKIPHIVAWVGKGYKNLVGPYAFQHAMDEDITFDPAVPVCIIGRIERSNSDHNPLAYKPSKKRGHKEAYPVSVKVTHAETSPFPLLLLLDIMDRAQAIHEASFVKPVQQDQSGDYSKSKEICADEAVKEILGVEYAHLARFVYLADHWWNDIEDLRNEIRGKSHD